MYYRGLKIMIEVLVQNDPYRYVRMPDLLENGKPDYRIQKFNIYTRRYNDMYLCDNFMQLDTAMEDFEYTKWLDPDDEVTAYAQNEGTDY